MLQNQEQVAFDQKDEPNTDNRLMDCTSFLSVTPSFNSNHNDQLSCSAIVQEDPTSEALTRVLLDVKGNRVRGVVL